MYWIIWQYEVAEPNRQEFEREYGRHGVWSQLFNTSPDFLGSYLSRDVDNETRYIVMDCWKGKKAYKHFLDENQEIYKDLSTSMKRHYQVELRLGDFESTKL